MPLPSPIDQGNVVARLDTLRACSERTIDSLRRQVSLLEEHRQALIIAAVTGELDIPGVAA
jgi:type I restriction enzyme S subunit